MNRRLVTQSWAQNPLSIVLGTFYPGGVEEAGNTVLHKHTTNPRHSLAAMRSFKSAEKALPIKPRHREPT